MDNVAEKDAEDYEKIPGEGLAVYRGKASGKIIVSGENLPGRKEEDFEAVYDPEGDRVSLSGKLSPETFLLAADFVYRHRLKIMKERS
ncbi:MAG: hypothetical protein LUD72_08830 [Bacteroidales bacterium]|nr:hypothetical protein [Bacteroidales bacterium]